jgi:hypothetical protein
VETDASFDVFMVVEFQVEVFSVVTPYNVVVGYQHFGGRFFRTKMEAAKSTKF